MACINRIRERILARHVLCFLFFVGFMVTFLLRVNINLAVVAMVASTTVQLPTNETEATDCAAFRPANQSSVTSPDINGTQQAIGEFEWDEVQQSIILSSFFWGYLLFQIPGGRVAELYGAKRVFGGAVIVNGLLSLVLPPAANTHWTLLLIIRALQGLAQGVQYPALSAAVVRWVPVDERARFISFAVQGASLGTVIALPLCGAILTTWGWPAVFYISGLLSLVWATAWWFFVFDSPQLHPRISREELRYLRDKLQEPSHEKVSVPWMSVLTSWQFIVGCIAAVGSDWGFHTLITLGPKFMKNSLGFDLEQSGWLTSLPFLCQYIFANIYGTLADCMLKRNMPLVHVRKISVCVSHLLPACGLLAMSFTGCNVIMPVVILTLSVSMIGAFTSGFFQTPLDIAPNFAGSLTGIMNAVGSITGIISTPVAGAILQNSGTTQGWRFIFGIAATMYAVCSLPYLLFATARTEPWNGPEKSEEKIKQFPMISMDATTADSPTTEQSTDLLRTT